MDRSKRMVKTTLIYFIGNFGSKLLSFFLLPVYTAWLNPEDFGKVDLLVSIVPLIGPVFTLQITESIFRFLFECKEECDYKENITSAFFMYAMGMISFGLLFVPFSIITKLDNWQLFLVYFVVQYAGIFSQQVLRGFGKSLDYAVTGIIATLVQGVANIVLIKYIAEKSLLVAPIAASGALFVYALAKSKMYRYIDFSMLKKEVIKSQMSYAVPLVPNQICWWFNGFLGKYVVLHFLGEVANGLLAVATKFPNLMSTITSIYFLAWTENSIIEYGSEDRDQYYSNNFNGLIEFLLYMSAPLIVVIKIYFDYMIAEEYTEAFDLVPVLIIGMIFNSAATFFGTIYTASKKTKAAFSTTIYAAVTNIIFSFLFIPTIGIKGYAYANLIAYIIFAIVRYWSIQKISKVQMVWKNYIKPTFLLLITCLLLGDTFYGNMLLLIACGIMFLYRYFDVFWKVIKRIKRNT